MPLPRSQSSAGSPGQRVLDDEEPSARCACTWLHLSDKVAVGRAPGVVIVTPSSRGEQRPHRSGATAPLAAGGRSWLTLARFCRRIRPRSGGSRGIDCARVPRLRPLSKEGLAQCCGRGKADLGSRSLDSLSYFFRPPRCNEPAGTLCSKISGQPRGAFTGAIGWRRRLPGIGVVPVNSAAISSTLRSGVLARRTGRLARLAASSTPCAAGSWP
jgi:hypothetical protein